MLIHGHRPSPSPIPLSEILERGDLILLLTPIVPPAPSPAGEAGGGGAQDPFEPLGRALARYHPWVRHVPYTPRGGITSTHAGFIRRARAVVFVISGPRGAAPGQPSQVDLFGAARAIGGEGRPHAVVACCDVGELELELGPAAAELPAVVQVPGYSPQNLEAAAGLLFFGGQHQHQHQHQVQHQVQQQQQRPEEPGPGPGPGPAPAPAPAVQLPGIASLQQPPGGAGDDTTDLAPIPAPAPGPSPQQQQQQHRWIIQEWDEIRDLPAVHDLWQTCMPRQFGAALSRPALQRLLQRDGYAKHFVARTPPSSSSPAGGGEVVGFCATYTTYLDSKDDVLVGSVAALLVREDHRNRGAGGRLHAEALRGFRKTRGVSRLQLGSTFPRLLYGLPAGCPAEGWFARRGWRVDRTAAGTGHEVADWVLALGEWPAGEGGFPPVPGLSFRPCGLADFDAVLGIVEGQSGGGGGGRGNMAWYDQYAKLAESPCMGDIVVALRGGVVVAAAITYVVDSENSSAEDIPWARTISDDTGGVTCICITGDDPAARDSVMVRLLDACVKVLRQQGMNRMYIDAVKGGEAGFQAIGFQKWASYMDVWRDA